jgi:hypothetical protein
MFHSVEKQNEHLEPAEAAPPVARSQGSDQFVPKESSGSSGEEKKPPANNRRKRRRKKAATNKLQNDKNEKQPGDDIFEMDDVRALEEQGMYRRIFFDRVFSNTSNR